MADIAIVTDSTVCLSRESIQKYGIEIVPMELILDGRVYKDGVDITASEFYKLLPATRKLPSTSAPSPGEYLEVLEKVAIRSKTILIITLSARLSHAFEAAKTAAAMCEKKLPDVKIEVLDCGTAAGAQGFVVLAAAKAAFGEKDIEKVIEEARCVMSKVNLIALIDTLHYLAKGGRVPILAAWATSILKIKPLFELLPMSKGVTSIDRVRTRVRAIERLAEVVKERVKGQSMHVVVMHTDALEEARKLKERIHSECNCVEIFIEDFTPVMGVHTGPGLLGVAFYTNEN